MIFKLLPIFFVLVISLNLKASKLKIVATLPEISWAIKKIGKDLVEVYELTNGDVDLHYLEARIDYILKLKKADAICYSGLGLEIGWLPKVIGRSGNLNLRKGRMGDCNLGTKIESLDKPMGKIDRSMGDIHPEGNPHYTLDPLSMIKASEKILEVLVSLDPKSEKFLKENYDKLKVYLESLHGRIIKKLSQSKKVSMISYHNEFSYWLRSFNLKSLGILENKPGVMPSGKRLFDMNKFVQSNNVKIILHTEFNSMSILKKFVSLSKIKPVKIDAHAQSSKENGYEQWQMKILNSVLNEINSTN